MRKWIVLLLAVLLLAATATACTQAKKAADAAEREQGTMNGTEKQDGAPVAEYRVTYYYSNKDASGLVTEERDMLVAEGENLLLAVARELQLPDQTVVHDVTVADGVITIDFNEKIHENFNGGSSYETLLIFSIVNTLTGLDGQRDSQVKFLVNGEEFESIGGHISLEDPFTRNENVFSQ